MRVRSRAFPNVVHRRSSPNHSARSTAISMLVLHSTESHNRPGNSDLLSLSAFGASPASQVSWHALDDADGNSARCVPDRLKAWTCGVFNSRSLNIEQIGRAATENWTRAQYHETARWLATWSRRHGVPLRRGRVSGTVVTRSGVFTHAQLGAAGGGHVDPGTRFSVRRVILLARLYLIWQKTGKKPARRR